MRPVWSRARESRTALAAAYGYALDPVVPVPPYPAYIEKYAKGVVRVNRLFFMLLGVETRPGSDPFKRPAAFPPPPTRPKVPALGYGFRSLAGVSWPEGQIVKISPPTMLKHHRDNP